RSIGRGGFSSGLKYHEPVAPGHRSSARKTWRLEDRLARPQAFQNRHGGKPVRHKPAACLEVAHRRAGLQSEPPARLAHIEAVARKVLLQLEPFGTGEHAL